MLTLRTTTISHSSSQTIHRITMNIIHPLKKVTGWQFPPTNCCKQNCRDLFETTMIMAYPHQPTLKSQESDPYWTGLQQVPTLCLTSRTTVPSACVLEEDACYHACNFSVSHTFKKESRDWRAFKCVYIFLDALSDVTVVTGETKYSEGVIGSSWILVLEPSEKVLHFVHYFLIYCTYVISF